MIKKRTNITMHPDIRALADEVMNARKFSDLSGFLEQLIREEYERRVGRMEIPTLEDLVTGYVAAKSGTPQSGPASEAAEPTPSENPATSRKRLPAKKGR